MAHSLFAPSSAPRVVKCPASFALTRYLPDDAGPDAWHGTAAHFLGETCLKGRCKAVRYAGCTIGVIIETGETWFIHERAPLPEAGAAAFEVDDEMVDAVQDYVDWCNEVGGDHHVEVRVDVTDVCPEHDEKGEPIGEQGGTSDHIACEPGVLTVTDLKYGMVQVFAEENEQALKYAYGAWKKFDADYWFNEIRIRICQPRLDHKDVWVITVEEMLERIAYIRERYHLAVGPNPPFGPGEKQCKFCKRSATCKPQADYLFEQRALAFDEDFGEFAVPDTYLLSDDDLVEAFRRYKMFKNRFEAVQREIARRALADDPIPGTKLVEARTRRRWDDPKAAMDVLMLDFDIEREKLITEKYVTPAQAEKLLSKADRPRISELAHKPPGSPRIALADDRRPEYTGSRSILIDEMFDVEESD